MMLKNKKTKQNGGVLNKTKNPTVLPRFSINQEKKDKRKLSILPTYFLVVKSIAPAPPPSGQHIFANLKSSQEKNIIRKNSRAKFKR